MSEVEIKTGSNHRFKIKLLVDATASGAFQHVTAPVNPPRSGSDLEIPQWATAGEDVIFSRLRLSLRRGGGARSAIQLLPSHRHMLLWAPHRDW